MLGKLAFTNKIVAKNLGIKEERVSGVMSFFVDELNKELMSCNHPFVYVRGLGTFTLALAPIESKIRRMIGHYKKVQKGIGIRNTEKSLVDLRRTIEELFVIRRLLKDKRKEIKKLRDDRKAEGNSKGELLPNDR